MTPSGAALPGVGEAPAGRAMMVGKHPAPVEGRTVDLALYSDLADERDRARATAVHLEQQLAKALAVHERLPVVYPVPGSSMTGGWRGEPACKHCRLTWPCPTARALGVEP